jgi:hypothetical protein
VLALSLPSGIVAPRVFGYTRPRDLSQALLAQALLAADFYYEIQLGREPMKAFDTIEIIGLVLIAAIAIVLCIGAAGDDVAVG